MYISCQVKVELLHWYDLRVPSTSCPALDTECGALARLTNTRKHLLLEMGSHCLERKEKREIKEEGGELDFCIAQKELDWCKDSVL